MSLCSAGEKNGETFAVTVLSDRCKCGRCMSNGQGEEGEEERGGGERWTRGDCAGGAGEGVQEVQVVKKKEKGDFGGWRKEECIRRSLCGDEAVSH